MGKGAGAGWSMHSGNTQAISRHHGEVTTRLNCMLLVVAWSTGPNWLRVRRNDGMSGEY